MATTRQTTTPQTRKGRITADDRSSMPAYSEYLRADTRPVPPILLEVSNRTDLGAAPMAKDRYLSEDWAHREQTHLWSKVWQMACREREILEPGDYVEYEIGDQSIIVIRDAQREIRAFHNVCLHRGTRLVRGRGNASALQCTFHGWTWETDGELAHVPCRWDFPEVSGEAYRLPAVKVDAWNGFVFVNLDPDAAPLADFIGDDVRRHWETWPLERRFKAAHVVKEVPCNWKVALEAFVEVYHGFRTHPQVILYSSDANGQYDQYGLHGRFANAMGAPSPHLGYEVDDQTVVDAMIGDALADAVGREAGDAMVTPKVIDGQTSRTVLADFMREQVGGRLGVDYSGAADCEMLDAIEYWIFPNLAVWGGYSFPLVYRALPGPTPDTSYFEVMILAELPEGVPLPPDVPPRFTPADEPWGAAPELGGLGPVLDQDMVNLPKLQLGLKSSGLSHVVFGEYQEANIRQFHKNLDAYLGEG